MKLKVQNSSANTAKSIANCLKLPQLAVKIDASSATMNHYDNFWILPMANIVVSFSKLETVKPLDAIKLKP